MTKLIEYGNLSISLLAMLVAAGSAYYSYKQINDPGPGLRIDSGDLHFLGITNCCIAIKGSYLVSNLETSDVVIIETRLSNSQNEHQFFTDVPDRFSIVARSTKEIPFVGYIYFDPKAQDLIQKDLLKSYVPGSPKHDDDAFQFILEGEEKTINALYRMQNETRPKYWESGPSIDIFGGGQCDPIAETWEERRSDTRPTACVNLKIWTVDGEVFSYDYWRIGLSFGSRSGVSNGWNEAGWLPEKYKEQ